MKISRFAFPNKEKTTVKRMLLVVAATLMFLSTIAVPNFAHADGEPACGGGPCKPLSK
jgi:hypothetical protein